MRTVAGGTVPTPRSPFPDPRLSYFYVYTSNSDLLGLHNVTTQVKFHVTPVNQSEDLSSLLRLDVDIFSQRSQEGYDAGAPAGWDFSKSFLFRRAATGEVESVQHHAEEREEVLALKKVLAGTLAMRLQSGEGKEWKYEGRETDHHGDLQHQYHATQGESGLTLKRFHSSDSDVTRTHEKVMELDHTGMIRNVLCKDQVLLNKSRGQDTSEIGFDREATIDSHDDEEFPTIQTSSLSTLRFTHSRATDKAIADSLMNLQYSSVQVSMKRTEKVALHQVQGKVESLLDCIAQHEDKTATNRTECVQQLRHTLESVREDDVITLARHNMERQCAKGDNRCEEERTLFLDLVAAMGCQSCQRLVLEKVLENPLASEEEIRRALLHAITLSQPLPETMIAVKTLCLGHEDSLHGSAEMSSTQRRACLTLGALVKTLHDQGNSSEAAAVAEKLESWLGVYNHTLSHPILRRRRRSAADPWDPVSHHHVITKAVLLHSLANGQLPRSRRHIRSYLEPNRGASVWRRGAIKSLVNSTSSDSLLLLLDLVAHDQDRTVRLEAKKLYHRHPLRNHTMKEQENLLLRRNYTYPMVARVRRAVLEISTEGGFSLKLQLPGINWDKVVGSSQIGATFGLHVNNVVDLQLKPLEGHFKVDVYDDAYAKAYVNIIGIKVDIFVARICYRGNIEYDLNVLKDFGINTFKDLLQAFDKIFRSITEPFKQALEAFRRITSPGFLSNILNELVQFIRNLPNIVRQFLKDAVEMAKRVAEFYGHPIIEKVKAIIQKVRSLFEEIRNDAMEFYNAVVNTVTVTVPTVTKIIKESVAAIVQYLKALPKSPVQSVSQIVQNVRKIRFAIGLLIGAKDRVLESANFLIGEKPFWLQIGETAEEVVGDLQDLLRMVETGLVNLVNHTEESAELARTDGFVSPAELREFIREELKALFQKTLTALDPLRNAVQPFFDLVRGILDFIKNMKAAYESIKQVVDKTRSTIEKLFGPKFHSKFPTHRRKETGSQCPSGVWPSTFGGKFPSPGVQVMLNEGSRVRNPVDGLVVRQSETEVLITPTDPSFAQFTILLANVEPAWNVTEKPAFFHAGDKLGEALRSGCMPNYIHVAVKEQEEDGEYVDPSPYLDRLLPIPQWIEECNEYIFDYIGRTADMREVGERVKKEVDEYKKDAQKRMEQFVEEETNKPPEPPYRPDWLPSPTDKTFMSNLKEAFNNVTEVFTDMKNFLANVGLPIAKDLLGFDTLTMGEVQVMVKDDTQLVEDIQKAIGELADKMREAPVKPPESFSISRMIHYIKKSGDSQKGDKNRLLASLLSIFRKKCKGFKDAVALEQGHVCNSHQDCRGLTCGLALQLGSLRPLVKVDFRAIGSNVIVTLAESSHSVPPDGSLATIVLPNPAEIPSFLALTLTLQAQMQADKVMVTAWASYCSIFIGSCLPDIPVFIDLPLEPGASTDSQTDTEEDAYREQVRQMGLEDFLLQTVSFGMEASTALEIMDRIREVLTNQVFGIRDKFENLANEEFKDKADLCIRGHVPTPTIDFTVFSVRYFFMVGPVPMSLGFGAGASVGVDVRLGLCILSMKFEARLTPWAGAKVWGDAAVDIGFARGGIRLVGYLLQTRFPITGTVAFPKFPLDVAIRMELELVPLSLKLEAFAEIRLLFVKKTVFRGTLWRYTAPAISGTVLDTHRKGDDNSPPKFGNGATSGRRRKRSSTSGCLVVQLLDRDVTSPAFRVEAPASDPTSPVTITFAVGTTPGGSDAMGWTELGGSSLTLPTTALPGGVPLYWTVRARNSQGLEAVAQCSLPTFDKTLPDGRVDASHAISSRPDTLSGTVFVFEDSELKFPQAQALGLAPGRSQSVMAWQPISVKTGSGRSDVTGVLSHFSPPKIGRLMETPLRTVSVRWEADCASQCVQHGVNCVAVSFEHALGTCELHGVVESPSVHLRVHGMYETMERLTSGRSLYIRHNDLDLQHGTAYFINVDVENVLGYRSFLTSRGTLIDLTPPSPGPVGQAARDEVLPQGCQAAPTQRCLDVTPFPNHRIIVDGPGAGTVFNGGERNVDMKYTSYNIFIRGHWDGFHDNETGIWGYTWSVGSKVCEEDVVKTADPHSHLSGPDYWTHSGQATGLTLPDGRYYQTVKALNNIEHGGALVTTVCHATPLIIDTTPPVFMGFQDLSYQLDIQLLKVSFKVDDDLSGVRDLDLGLGRTKYDVSIRAFSPLTFTSTPDVTAAVEDFTVPDGVPAWLLVQATNGASLTTMAHSERPLLVDSTPPWPGWVGDGERDTGDLDFQTSNSFICGHWHDFHDGESGILRYQWGVGTTPGSDDVISFTQLPHDQHSHCADAKLEHNQTYFSTVEATNAALNPQTCTASSNGVLVDVTVPEAGAIQDGASGTSDLDFTSERGVVQASWEGFSDPESGIRNYDVRLFLNKQLLKESTLNSSAATFEDHTVSLQHGDFINFRLTARNGAGATVEGATDGFTVDLTPPLVDYIRVAPPGGQFQADNSSLRLAWQFSDPESGIKEYRVAVFEEHHGSRNQFWPAGTGSKQLSPSASGPGMEEEVTSLELRNGARYFLQVTGVNGALFPKTDRSPHVTVDTTPPVLLRVHLGLLSEDEEEDEQGRVLHTDQSRLTVSWEAADPESGITSVAIALGTDLDPTSVTGGYRIVTPDPPAVLESLTLESSSQSQALYRVRVKVTNGAGVESQEVLSKPIYVLAGNVPGTVFDGGALFTDADFQKDRTTITASFSGFASEACGIVSYEWGVGTQPFFTDVLAYTSTYITMVNHSAGFMQAHVTIQEGLKYYVTVKAITGHSCHEEFIVASSNGVALATTAPVVAAYTSEGKAVPGFFEGAVLFQNVTNSIDVVVNVTDSAKIVRSSWCLGSLEARDDVMACQDGSDVRMGHVALPEGRGTFLHVEVENEAGLRGTWRSAAITADTSPPSVEDLTCSPAVSTSRGLVTCNWQGLRERESRMTSLAACVSTVDNACDVTSATLLSLDAVSWHGDVNHLVENGSLSSVYVILQTSNVVGLQRNTAARITVDRTPPVSGRVSVVTGDVTGDAGVPTQCQTSTEFLEVLVEGFQDEESGIDKCEVALETTEGAADIRGFEPLTPGRVELLTGLHLPEASHVTAVARCSNKAGLFSVATSLPLAVSPGPLLSVLDGPGQSDLDFQSSLTSMGGRWLYSDACPVVSSQWRLETLDRREVIAFHDIPVLTTSFSSDAIDLQRDVTYVNVIKTVDALNRTRISRSDGIAVRVEPPYPGEVRDGEERDLDFQLSNTTLSVNWDHFGMPGSSDATQRIVRYEVGIGDGLSYENGLSNIQPFTSVGLNLSVTFTDLTLTSKDVTYFATVRAYSEAGGMQEATSDGVKVGYDPEIHPGIIDLPRFSSSPSRFTFSWSPFTSDLGMAEYKVALTNTTTDLPNGTFFLKDWPELMLLEPQPLTSVGVDTMVTLENLTLAHEQEFYVIVVGIDKTDKCGAATAGPVLVDVTPPEPGNVTVHGAVYGDAAFIPSSSEVSVTWEDFQDPESGVTSCTVRLLSFQTCVEGDGTELAVMEVVGENRTSFFRSLDVGQIHRVDVTCSNGAKERVTSRSLPIMVDATPPLPGSVKVGWDWRHPAYVQSDTSSVKVSVAVSSGSNVSCQRESSLFPSGQAQSTWTAQGPPFSPGAVYLERGKIYVSVGYDDTLTKVQKGGMKSSAFAVVEGNYTIRFRAAQADNVVTSYVFGLPDRTPAETFFYPRMENSSRTFSNDSSSSSLSEEFTPDFGFSLSVYGWSDNGTWWCLASIRDDVQAKWAWIRLPFDPTASEYDYTFGLVRDLDDMVPSWSIYVFMGGDVAQMFRGLRLPEKMALYLETVNNEGFAPPMDDPFAAAFTVAQISSVRVPLAPMPDCVYGAAFSDQDFGLMELWLGVTDTENATDSVSPMTLLHSFCRPCPSNGCTVGCDPNCTREASWQLLQLEVEGLTLTPGKGMDQAAESASDNVTVALDRFREMNYYVTVRAVNFAGVSREAKSNRFMVDVTPPQFEFLSCTDPSHSVDEPVDFVGSNSSVGAFWECDEEVSAITRYTIAVGTSEGEDDVYSETSVKTKTKVALQLMKEHLNDNQTYYVTVKAENSAGLSSTLSCNVTAELSTPELPASLEDSTLYTSRDLSDIPVALTHLQDRVGVVLPANEDPRILYYEWDVGTVPGGGALFRTVAVGSQGSTRLEVRDGELFINGQRRNDSLEQPRNISQLQAEQGQQTGEGQDQVLGRRQGEGRTEGQPKKGTSGTGQAEGSEQGQGSDQGQESQGGQRSGWVNGTAYDEELERNNGTVLSNGTEVDEDQSSKEGQGEGQTENESEISTTATPPPQNFLRLEPGRCYFQTLRVVSRAHVSTATQPMPVCVKREQDRALDLRNGTVTLSVSANSGVVLREKRSTSDRMDVFKVVFKGLDGAAVVGALNPSDLEQDYGSSAALDYRPFIGQDLTATAPSSRFLARRLVRYTGASLYISPTPFAVSEGRVQVELQIPSSSSLSPDNQYSPLVWNADRQKWMHWDELCPADTKTDCVIGEPSTSIQSEFLSAHDFTTTTLFRPLHVAVFEMRRSIQNSPPVLDNLSISGAEDSVLETKLVVEDEEDDDVTFTLTSSGQNGVADLTTTGDLRYIPKKEFCGGDSLQVLVAEVNVPEGVTANRVTYDLSVQITCANDAPTLHLVAMGQTVNALTSEEVTLTWRGLLTLMPTLASLGHFVLADPDLGDDLEIEYRQDDNQQVILQVDDVTATGHGVDLSHWSGQTVRVFELRMPRPSNVPGDLRLHVISRDRGRLYSRALKVTVTFRDVLCSTGSCGKFSLAAMARDEEKKFLEYVPPQERTDEAKVNETDSSHSSIQVNSTAVRLYLSSHGFRLDLNELRDKMASLLAQRLGVSPNSLHVTLEASEPVLGASGSITEVLMSVTVDGVPLSSAKLADFVTASKSTLERELGVSVDRTVPTHFGKTSLVRILMITLPIAAVLLILAVAVVVYLVHRNGKTLLAWKLQASKRRAKDEDTLVLQELDEEIDNLSKESSQTGQGQGSGYFQRKEDQKESESDEEELPRSSEDHWSSQQELVTQSSV